MTTHAAVSSSSDASTSALWAQLRGRLVVIAWTAAYVVALLVSTGTLIAPLFGYYGYVPRVSAPLEWLVVIDSTVVVALTMPARCRRPSDVAVLFLVLTVAIPVMWIPLLYGPLDTRQVCLLSACTAGAFVMTWLMLLGTRTSLRVLVMRRRTYWIVLAAALVAALGYLAVTSGVTPDLVGFDDVYGQRAAYAGSISRIGAYLVGWLSGGLLPVMLALGLYRRNPLLIGAGLVGVLFLYSLSGQKTYAIGVPIVIGTYLMTRRGRSRTWHWIGLLTAVIALAGGLDHLRHGYAITSLLVRRGITTAGVNSGYYIDLFDSGPLYQLRHSALALLGDPPYDVPPAVLVGRSYYSDGTIANANYLADGFANFGWIGLVGSGVVLGLVLRVFDSVSADLPLGISAPSLVFVLQAVANTAILTTILSHGAAVVIALVALMPASVACTARDDPSRRRGERTVAQD